jgi:hypothetical protein
MRNSHLTTQVSLHLHLDLFLTQTANNLLLFSAVQKVYTRELMILPVR